VKIINKVDQNAIEMQIRKARFVNLPVASLISNQIGLAKNLLLYIYYGPDEITMGEIGEILDILLKAVNPLCNILWNCGYDPNLRDDMKISIIWTGLEKLPV
jgi:cell division protein FtsZ